MNNARQQRQIEIAATIAAHLEEIVRAGRPADAALAAWFRQHPEYGSRDRRYYSHVAFSYFRWLGWTRRLAPDDLTKRCAWAVMLDPASDEEMRERWRMTAGISPEQSDALHHADLNAQSGLVSRGIEELMPDWLGSFLNQPEDRARLIQACRFRPPTWLCVAPEPMRAFTEMLTAQTIRHRVDGRIAGAIEILVPFHIELLQRAWGGTIQVQDIASQAVVKVCAARPGERWWDACSGAGGKTLGLSHCVGPAGQVHATDTRSSILDNLRQRAMSHRRKNIDASILDAAEGIPDGPGFDGVLVDAPCSGIGTWTRNPDARWRTSPDMIDRSATLQAALLHRASAAVRPGGVLVYSVCTLTNQEGPALIDDFLMKHPDFQRNPVPHPLTGEPTDGALRIHPDEGPGDGMYIARMVRK